MEGLVALVAYGEAAVAGEPGQGPLDHPALPPQARLVLHAPAGDAIGDAPLGQRGAAGGVVVALVGVQLGGAAGGAVRAGERRQRVEQRREDGAVVPVGPGQPRRERESAALDQEVPFGARFAAIRRVRADRIAPFLAAMRALFTHARDQSSLPASSNRSSSTRWRRRHTPARSQSRSRRQHVTLLPQPSSAGSHRHWMPVRNTKMMPHNAARSATGGRPPRGRGGRVGSSGAIMPQRSSETSSCTFIPPPAQHRCHGFETASNTTVVIMRR